MRIRYSQRDNLNSTILMNMDNKNQLDILQELMQVEGPVETRENQQKRISSKKFQNVKKTTSLWIAKNKILCEMHENAVNDYVISRNAIMQLGILTNGLSLAAQSVEKYLKCYLLACGLTMKEIRKFSHNIQSLLENASKISKQKELMQFMEFSKKLEKWYNSRYPDTDDPAFSWGRNETRELDRFIYHMEDNIPIPKKTSHIKYGGGEMGHEWSSIFVRLFDNRAWMEKDSILYENEVLAPIQVDLETKYLECRLLALMPSTTQIESAIHQKRIDFVMNKYKNE